MFLAAGTLQTQIATNLDRIRMTAEQSLVGAMGCASWRAHHRLREYAETAPSGGIIRGGPRSQPTTRPAVALGLNEVGVTDAVMAVLWRLGPEASAYSISPGAESNHLGADIAFVHSATKRVLLYQAKLAKLDGTVFRLKSDASTDHVEMLTRASVKLNGVAFAVTGRMALYQTDSTPFLKEGDHFWFDEWEDRWHRGSLHREFTRRPEAGGRYYEHVLRHGCSPSGVLAAPVPDSAPVSAVVASASWPWEFDMYDWLGGLSPLHEEVDAAVSERVVNFDERVPDFAPYSPTESGAPAGEAAELALQLATQLNFASGRVLYMVHI
jgi:hypothetical protein